MKMGEFKTVHFICMYLTTLGRLPTYLLAGLLLINRPVNRRA